MKGFSLLELLIAVSFFLVILLAGYKTFDSQKCLFDETLIRTRPEEESNYRLLVLKDLILLSSGKLKRDPMLEAAPFFFQDLRLGEQQRTDSFSFAYPVGNALPFQREGKLFRIPASPVVQTQRHFLLAGLDCNGSYNWNYGITRKITPHSMEQRVQLKFLLDKPLLDFGTMIECAINGFLFEDNMLYWVSPSGRTLPFFGPLEDFRYEWNGLQLKVCWQKEPVNAEFSVQP